MASSNGIVCIIILLFLSNHFCLQQWHCQHCYSIALQKGIAGAQKLALLLFLLLLPLLLLLLQSKGVQQGVQQKGVHYFVFFVIGRVFVILLLLLILIPLLQVSQSNFFLCHHHCHCHQWRCSCWWEGHPADHDCPQQQQQWHCLQQQWHHTHCYFVIFARSQGSIQQSIALQNGIAEGHWGSPKAEPEGSSRCLMQFLSFLMSAESDGFQLVSRVAIVALISNKEEQLSSSLLLLQVLFFVLMQCNFVLHCNCLCCYFCHQKGICYFVWHPFLSFHFCCWCRQCRCWWMQKRNFVVIVVVAGSSILKMDAPSVAVAEVLIELLLFLLPFSLFLSLAFWKLQFQKLLWYHFEKLFVKNLKKWHSFH